MSEPGLRLQKAIAQAGLASRRAAERLILEGQVRVNGEIVRQMGVRLAPEDTLVVRDRPVGWSRPRATEVWALYKPRRCVTTMSDPEGRATVADLLPASTERLFPVGRLDYDAEGLVLLTNDGSLAQRIAHPAHGMTKVYLVKVKGLVTPETLAALDRGPHIDGRRRTPARARVLHHPNDKTWLEVTLKEGVQHHIKKMFADRGHRVLKIKRYQVGPIALEDLTAGECRKLTPAEVAQLLKYSSAAPPRRAPRPSDATAR